MSYDHQGKAGNAADVWKHFILLTVAEKLLAQHDRKTEFHYVESHCGQGIYPLLPGEVWLAGIHKLTSSSEDLLQGRYKRYCQEGLKHNRYLGSWQQIARLTHEHNQPARLILADHAAAVEQRIHEMAPAPSIHFSRTDGFQLLSRTTGASLVLVDPPYSGSGSGDFQKAEEAGQALLSKEIPHLIWYPIIQGGGERFASHARVEILWPQERGRMQGCGMAMNASLYNLLEAESRRLEALKRLFSTSAVD